MPPRRNGLNAAVETSDLELVADTSGFFYEALNQAVQENRVKLTPEAHFYLVQLLASYVSVDALYKRDGAGHHQSEPLALIFKEAIEASSAETQRLLFRQVGDVSLYMAGYFQDSLRRKIVDIDYYIEMGEAAYQSAAQRSGGSPLSAVLEELAATFARCVELFATVSERTFPRNEADLLRLYEAWSRTGSERAARQLQAAGIQPTAMPKKSIQ